MAKKKAAWKQFLIDKRSQVGGTGLAALQQAQSMGASVGEINKFLGNQGWTIGGKAQEAGFAPAKQSNKNNKYDGPVLAPMYRQLNKDQQQAAKALGINNVNKPAELERINNYVSAAQQSRTNPVYQQAAKNLGITNYNSINDYAQVVNRMAGTPVQTQTASPFASSQDNTSQPSSTYTPTPLVDQPQQTPETFMPVEQPLPAPDTMFSPGGMGSSVDGGAMGFRRRKSSARMAGLTTKGTSRLRINPGFSKSSGLNIGI